MGGVALRWEHTIKQILQVRREGTNCIYLVQDRVHWRNLVSTVMDSQVEYFMLKSNCSLE
jgi:hypothetical protein